MSNSKHVKALASGANTFNEWRREKSIAIDISDANCASLNLVGCDLHEINARKTILKRSNLRRANLENADLSNADLSYADLTGANLNDANLHQADLSGATLLNTKLYRANLTGANLIGANMERAFLHDANLRRANLSKASLKYAELFFTILIDADLDYAHLNHAELVGVNLSGASLHKTNLRDASIRKVTFSDIDMSTIKWLTHINHEGPSSLDVNTIIKSNGRIPEIFMRGCGIPDTFIQHLDALLQKPIQYYSCFISYSSKDQDFADRLYADLQANNVRCWFAREDIQGGKKLHHQIDEAIKVYDRLLLILSENSMDSEWVKTEIAKARKREIRQSKKMLFPVRLVDMNTLNAWECFDSDVGKDTAREIREYFIPDFSNWSKDNKKYQVEFKKLLRDLKANL